MQPPRSARTKPHPVTAYARKIASGRKSAGKYAKLACQRHLDDLETGHLRGLYFDPAAADHAIEFYQFLRHSKGEWAGQPIQLSDWQIFTTGCLFGWKRADGTRRFRTGYEEVPRKSGKSTKAAGVALYLLLADGEPGAEILAAATKRDQAKIVFGEAQAMVSASPSLSRRLDVRENIIRTGRNTFVPLSADSSTMDGLNPHGSVIDELHAHKTRHVYDVINSAMGARRQPLMYIITTAGRDDDASIGVEIHNHAVAVLEGLQDDEFFCYIAHADPGDDWTKPATWRKANPNYGISVKPADLARQCKAAKAIPGQQNEFLQKRLNIWVGQEKRWLDMAAWRRCGKPFAEADLAGRAAWGGLDLSTKLDLSAFVLAFPPLAAETDWHLICRFYLPEDGLQARAQRDRVDYLRWVREGFLVATPGNVVDYEFIRADVHKLSELFLIQEIGYDPWKATQIAVDLQNDGYEMVEMRQGFATMAGPTRFFEELVVSGTLNHGNHPILAYHANNVAIRRDANDNYMPDKRKSTKRIDGVVASIMGISRARADTGNNGLIEIPTDYRVTIG